MLGVLAHLGGLDEIGIFVLPAVAVILFLRRSEKKAKERLARRQDADVDG